jgi:hypothetical protein
MPDGIVALLANPLVRQLTTSSPDEMPVSGAVAAALDILANASLVGLRHQPSKFLHGLAELLDEDPSFVPQTPVFKPVGHLAAKLRESGEVDVLLEQDVELYHYVEAAFNKAITDAT